MRPSSASSSATSASSRSTLRRSAARLRRASLRSLYEAGETSADVPAAVRRAATALPSETPEGEAAPLGFGAQVPFGPMLAIAGAVYFLGARDFVLAWVADLAPLFASGLIAQELSTETDIEIPEAVREAAERNVEQARQAFQQDYAQRLQAMQQQQR